MDSTTLQWQFPTYSFPHHDPCKKITQLSVLVPCKVFIKLVQEIEEMKLISEKLNKSDTDEYLVTQWVCNCSETFSSWWYLPWNTVLTPQKSAPSGFRLKIKNIYAYSNAAETQKWRWIVVGSNRNLCTLKGVEGFFQSQIQAVCKQYSWYGLRNTSWH
jgi:hypothetical protein